MVSRYVTSIQDIPGWSGVEPFYRVWNWGDIAKEDGLPIEANPFSPDTQRLEWHAWRRGWRGEPFSPVVDCFVPVHRYVGEIRPIITRRRRWRALRNKIIRCFSRTRS